MAFCAKCGAQVNQGAAFCQACGAAVSASTMSPEPAAAPTATAPTSTGMSRNVAAALSYIFPVAIVFLAIDPYKQDPFVRFHSFQAIFYWVGAFVIRFAFAMVLPWTMWSLLWLLSLVIFAGWVFLVFKAYNNERFKFPVIGDIAEKQAGA